MVIKSLKCKKNIVKNYKTPFARTIFNKNPTIKKGFVLKAN